MFPQENGLERIHAGIDEEQGRIILGHHGHAFHDQVIFFPEKIKEILSDLMRGTNGHVRFILGLVEPERGHRCIPLFPIPLKLHKIGNHGERCLDFRAERQRRTNASSSWRPVPGGIVDARTRGMWNTVHPASVSMWMGTRRFVYSMNYYCNPQEKASTIRAIFSQCAMPGIIRQAGDLSPHLKS
jgi:hypothetical protein